MHKIFNYKNTQSSIASAFNQLVNTFFIFFFLTATGLAGIIILLIFIAHYTKHRKFFFIILFFSKRGKLQYFKYIYIYTQKCIYT